MVSVRLSDAAPTLVAFFTQPDTLPGTVAACTGLGAVAP